MSTTQFETYESIGLRARSHPSSSSSAAPPPYYNIHSQGTRLGSISSLTSSSLQLPRYTTTTTNSITDDDTGSFQPTIHLQIETRGKPVIGLPLPPRPDPIPVYAVTESGAIGEQVYESVRTKRSSGNCSLYSARRPGCAVSMTTYRFGPGRAPRMRIFKLHGNNNKDSDNDGNYEEQQAEEEESLGKEEFQVTSKGCTTRTVTIRTHLGTFQWRYANKQERRQFQADSLLIMERIIKVATVVEGSGGRTENEVRRRRVAQLVRNAEFRTSGTGRCTSGNGGRLMIDLGEWRDCQGEGGEGEQFEVLAVTGCLVMLKKEVDRRRMYQMMMMGGAAGGGP